MTDSHGEEETNTATMRPLFEPVLREDLVAPAQHIGRFMVLGRVGAGGMGQVYAAYDPVLDRRVALKILHAERTEKDRDALVREAKALARLNHPNVVAVHDVGVHDGLVFLAMEYVEGSTLKEWVSSGPGGARPTADVLDALLQAGLGLAAAHEAGLVHGDFKPHNVLVGLDGRVRVADFGLARAEQLGASERKALAVRTVSDDDTWREGPRDAVAGTPAYMAPEHRGHGRVDPKTDQYSYSVTAWEMLFGCRPPEVTDDVALPNVVESGLKKGLSDRPSARHRSMDSLLDTVRAASAELQGDRSRRLGRYLAAGAMVAVAAAVVAGYWAGQVDDADAPCSGAEAELDRVWNADVEASVRGTILATGVSFAAQTEGVVAKRLDVFGREWVDGYTEACETSQIRREQSEAVMDLRMGCLDQRLREFRAVTGVLNSLDEERVRNAVEVVEGLASPRDCSDLEYIGERAQVPANPELRVRVADVRETLAGIEATHRAGRYAEAKAAAVDALVTAHSLEFKPLVAEAKYQLGREQKALGETEESIESLKDAFLIAQAVNDGPLAAQAAMLLSLATGDDGHDVDRGLLWNDIALSTAERAGAAGKSLVARSLSARADVLHTHGDYKASLVVQRKSMGLLEPGTLAYAGGLSARGAARTRMGDVDGGLDDLEKALAVYRKVLGDGHPTVADVQYNLAIAHSATGHYADALRLVRGAKDIYEAHQGPNGRDVGLCVSSAASLSAQAGRPNDALVQHREALGILTQALGPDHLEVASEWANIGMTLALLGRVDESVASIRSGLEIVRSSLGPTHPATLSALTSLANVLADAGKSEEALVVYQEAISGLGEGSPPRSEGLVRANLGLLYAERGDFDAAMEEYDLVLDLFQGAPMSAVYQNTLANAAEVWLETGQESKALENGEQLLRLPSEDPTMVADAKFVVARALWETGGDRGRARTLATEAEAAYIEADAAGFEKDIAEVRAWLKAHR